MRAAGLFAALIVLAALPSALAQLPVPGGVTTSLSVILVDSGKPAFPERSTLVPIQIAYQWQAGGASNTPTRIELLVEEAPGWAVNAHVDPPVLEAKVPGASSTPRFDTRAELNATLNFTVPRHAPAFQTGNFTVLARAAPNGNLAGSEGRGILTTRPDYVGNLSLAAPHVVARGGGWTTVPWTVTNHGNGATQVKLSVQIKPEPSEVELPTAVSIPVNGSAVLELKLRLPWTTGIDGTLNVTADGTSVVNPRATAVQAVGGTTVDGRSAVPLPAWLPLAAAAMALALLRKPRKQRPPA